MVKAPPFACTVVDKPILATTTASLAICHKALCLYILVLAIFQKIDSIEVAWPSGRKQVIRKGLTDNQALKITEPEK
jgi:hypothetical protein